MLMQTELNAFEVCYVGDDMRIIVGPGLWLDFEGSFSDFIYVVYEKDSVYIFGCDCPAGLIVDMYNDPEWIQQAVIVKDAYDEYLT